MIVCDMHSDIMMDVYLKANRRSAEVLLNIHYPKLRQGGVNFTWLTVGGDWSRLLPESPHPTVLVLELLSQLQEGTAAEDCPLVVVRTGTEAERVIQAGKIALLPTIEGGAALGGRLRLLEQFYKLGVRSMCLTHRYRNELADGNREARTHSGLSSFGVEVVQEMNRLGMIIDISHLTGQAVEEVLSMSRMPVVASHSNARALHDHVRNLTDDELRQVARTGGMVGVCLVKPFLGTDNVGVEQVLAQIDYMVELIGIDHVGIGADFVDYWDQSPGFPEGLEDTTKLSYLLACLRARGYSPDQVEKIAGANALRLCKEVLY